MGTSKQTDRSYAGPMSPQARMMLERLAQTQGGNQAMQDLAAGKLEINAQDRVMVQQAQDATGQLAMSQMEQGMEQAMRMAEAQGLDRGIEGSSLEAVNNALIGQDMQRQIAQLAMQQQAQGAQQLMNMPMQRAQSTMNANQILMNRLVQGAQVGLGYDQGIRQLNQTRTSEKPSDLPGQVLGMGAQIGSAIASGGASIPLQISMQGMQGGQQTNPGVQQPTFYNRYPMQNGNAVI